MSKRTLTERVGALEGSIQQILDAVTGGAASPEAEEGGISSEEIPEETEEEELERLRGTVAALEAKGRKTSADTSNAPPARKQRGKRQYKPGPANNVQFHRGRRPGTVQISTHVGAGKKPTETAKPTAKLKAVIELWEGRRYAAQPDNTTGVLLAERYYGLASRLPEQLLKIAPQWVKDLAGE